MSHAPLWKVLGFCGVLASCMPPVDRGEVSPPEGTGGMKPPVGGSGAGGAPGTGGVLTGPGFLARSAVSAERFAPPVSGGTLLVLADGRHAAAADPDRDALFFADLVEERLQSTLTLEAGDEP